MSKNYECRPSRPSRPSKQSNPIMTLCADGEVGGLKILDFICSPSVCWRLNVYRECKGVREYIDLLRAIICDIKGYNMRYFQQSPKFKTGYRSENQF